MLLFVYTFFSLDVWGTIQTDIDLEKQRLQAMQDCIILLVHEWVRYEHISSDLETRSIKKFQRNSKDALKRLDDEYREDCREVVKKLSVQNQVRLGTLIDVVQV